MKAISYSACDHSTRKKTDDSYHYENYTVRAARRVTEEVLMRYVKSKRVESFSGIVDFWYFDVQAYQKDLEFSGHEIPKEAM